MPEPEQAYLTSAYTEVCRSYQALHDFRMKLLSLLPIASIAAFLVLLGKSDSALPPDHSMEAKIIGAIGLFSALFTVALFFYEARGILMCHDLYHTGAALERTMKVNGQFIQCDERRNLSCYSETRRRYARKINDKIASSMVYSLTFAAWFFVGLRFVFHVQLQYCALWASITGLLLAIVSIVVLNAMTASPKVAAKPLVIWEAELGIRTETES
jgi:hypothetical protein